MKTIQKRIKEDVDRITLEVIRSKMPDPKMVDVKVYHDLASIFSHQLDYEATIPAGSMSASAFLKAKGYVKCTKSEAAMLVVIGERANGAWIIGKSKNYWVKNQA